MVKVRQVKKVQRFNCEQKALNLFRFSVLQSPSRNCLKDTHPLDLTPFSVCGDQKVEGDEECDCGLHYETCSDPCCYAAHISPWDLAANKSATPCRRNRSVICLHPWKPAWQYGLLAPWIFIPVVTVCLAVGLIYDWRHDKVLYDHVTKPCHLIGSGTSANGQKRRGLRDDKIFLILGSQTHQERGKPNYQTMPDVCKPGIVEKLKCQLEMKA